MKNKRILSFIFAVIILLGSLVFPVYADKEPVAANVFISESYLSDENWWYSNQYTIIGRKFDIIVDINGIESISECDISFEYNDEILQLENSGVIYGSSDINYMPLSEETVSGNQISVHIYDEKGIANPDLFTYVFGFKAISKGSLDIKAEITKLIDGDGNSHEAEVVLNVPSYTYEENEIPDVLPDFEISLSYGLSRYIDTELAYPMTVAEFAGKMQNAENCEIIIKDRFGELLDADAMIPTGATVTVFFDKMEVFHSTFTCIGDVDCDGKITSADARMVLRCVARLDLGENVTTVFSNAANTSMDTYKLNAADAREILRYCAGIGETYADWYDYHCALNRTNRYLINDNV